MRIFGLDMIRAVAILNVVVCHVFVGLQNSYPLLSQQYPLVSKLVTPTGYLGVEIFFVLSGFLIGQIILRLYRSGLTWPKIKDFYVRRWFRTLPLYYLLLLIKFIVQPAGFPLTALVFIHPLFPADIEYFRASWSLAVEEWFYLLFPLVCWAVSQRFKQQRLGYVVLCLIFGLIIVRTWYVGGHQTVDFDHDIRMALPLRFDAILLGVLLAIIKHNWSAVFQRLSHWSVGVGSILAYCVLYVTWSFMHHAWDLPLKTATIPLVSLTVMGCLPWLDQSVWINQTLARIKWLNVPFTQISLISYSLYLTNSGLMNKLKFIPGNPLGTTLNVIWVVGLMFAVATFFFYCFEKPVLGLRDKLSKAA
jgi:peptidoglycan/LPS O-acetylase OafA/YrhL